MFIELTSGSDSFRAQGASPLRNVQVKLFTATDEGIMPLFAAFQKKIKGYKESRVIMNIPATEQFAIHDAGVWYRNRYEIAPETEIMIEYQHRDRQGGFSTDTEYMLIKTDPNAPLHYVRLALDDHPMSAVPYVFFEGRFHVIHQDDQISNRSDWQKHIGLNADQDVTLIVDCNLSEPGKEFFTVKELEPGVHGTDKPEIVTTEGGKRKIKRIKRARRIKTR
jgi:hypothetical protein